ncbi:MAG: tetratricopeptide repeat protein [Leptolyngbyaceae cyanobacterium]
MNTTFKFIIAFFITGISCCLTTKSVSAQNKDFDTPSSSALLSSLKLSSQSRRVSGLIVQAQTQVQTGEIEAAVATYEKAFSFYKTSCRSNSCTSEVNGAAILSAIAYLQIKLGNFEAAVDAFREALTFDSKNANFYYGLGYSLAQVGRFSEAKAAYRQSTVFDTRKIEASLGLGAVLVYEHNYTAAALVYLSALSLKPNDVRVLEALSSVHILQGQYEKAVNLLQRAIQLDPKQPKLQKMFAISLARAEGKTNPLKVLLTIGSKRLNLSSFIEVAETLIEAGDVSSASRIFYWVSLLRSDSTELQQKIGDFWMQRQNYSVAAEAYRQWIKLEPESPEAHYKLATALYELGQLEQATKTFEYARSLYEKFIALDNQAQFIGDAHHSQCTFVPYITLEPLGLGQQCFSSGR